MKRVTVAPYQGGKNNLAPLLNAYMKPSERYISGFGGMANEILIMPPHREEIYNDIDKNQCILFACLSDKGKREELFQWILQYPYDEDTFNRLREKTKDGYQESVSQCEYASWVWYLRLASFNGAGRSFKRKAQTTWTFQKSIARKFYGLSRLDGLVVWNKDIFTLMEEESGHPNGEGTFYFLDSPYLENKAGYTYNMTSAEEHERYCRSIGEYLKGGVMVCGYDEPQYCLYDEILCRQYGFHKIPLKERPVSMALTEKGGKKTRKTECIWVNYER